MTTKYFYNSYHCIEEIKKDILSDEQRELAFKYILNSYTYCWEILKNNLYKNNNELVNIKKKLLRDPYYCAMLLIEKRKLLNQQEIETAIELVLEDPIQCRDIFLKCSFLLNEETKLRCLDMITLSDTATIKFFNSCLFTDEEALYVLQKLSKYNKVLIHFLSLKKPLIKSNEFAFDKILLDKYDTWQLVSIHWKKLSIDMLKIIYDKYGYYYCKNSRGSFNNYLKFCEIFNGLLTTEHQKILVNKLMKKSYKNQISYVLNKIKLDNNFIEMLNSFLVMEKLSKN